MYHVSLPALVASGENKGKPSIVEVTSAKLVETNPAGGKDIPHTFKIPAEEFSYPQFGPEPKMQTVGEGDNARQVEVDLTEDEAQQGIEEAIQDVGGKVRFLATYNAATRTAALNAGKGYIRTKETGAFADIIAAGLKMVKDFSWAKAEKLTNKEVRERVEDLAENLDTLSADELKAKLKAILGK